MTRPWFRGAVRVKPPKGGVGERSEFWAGDGIEWDDSAWLAAKIEGGPPAGFTSRLGSELRWEPAELRVLSKAKLGRLSLPRKEQRGGDRGVCRACACELQRARVLSLAQCDVGRGGWSRELYFPPSPSRSPPSPATPPSVAQPPAAICITKARRSGEEKGRGVRLSPRPGGQSCCSDPSEKKPQHSEYNRNITELEILRPRPHPSSIVAGLPLNPCMRTHSAEPPPCPFARLGAHLLLSELVKTAPPTRPRQPACTIPTSGKDC